MKNNKTNENKSATTETEAPKLGKLGGYLGHSVVSVIRTLGKAGLTFKEIRAGFDKQGVVAADQTIRIQRKCGVDGVGSQAELTVKQIAQLKGKVPKAVSKDKPAKAPKAKAPKADQVADVAADRKEQAELTAA